jgi:Protein of unknown function (DUF3040)
MGSPDDEQRILDAIENQLRAEEPQLVGYFSALGSVTPWIKPMNDRGRAAPHRKEARRGRRPLMDKQRYAIVIELVLVITAVVLIVMVIVGAVWMLAALSHA